MRIYAFTQYYPSTFSLVGRAVHGRSIRSAAPAPELVGVP